jgi:SMC interacting uncharacterized protein involved in chromosome segregation
MKTVTVSVDDEVYHRACAKAVEKRTSLAALIKKFLTQLVEEESEFERLKREEKELRASLKERGVIFSARDNLPREALYDRNALRGCQQANPTKPAANALKER